jgi:acetyl-CoA C-acetyltransferase
MTGKLSRPVYVVGAGMSRFGTFPRLATRDLFVDAVIDMVASVDQGVDPRRIEAVMIGNYSSDLFERQGHTAPFMADWAGIAPRPATRVENACASGGTALYQGIQAVASGLYDIVLVGGIEKMTDLPTDQVTDTLATAGDGLYEVSAGFTFPGFYAAMATAYMDRYGATPEALMRVAIKAHENGAKNAKAQFGVTIRDIMRKKVEKAKEKGSAVPEWADEMAFLHDPVANPMVAWPLRLFDCSPISDGAAAVLVVAENVAKSFSRSPLQVRGMGQGSDVALYAREDVTALRAARVAAEHAYAMAGVKPSAIRIAEVHDCFTIAEVIATEDLGFFAAGEGARAAEEGVTARDGRMPINTSGGLKSKGHPVGASGVAQVVEVWKQMHGLAGERQVSRDVDLALTHNVGGTGQTCLVHIFERG